MFLAVGNTPIGELDAGHRGVPGTGRERDSPNRNSLVRTSIQTLNYSYSYDYSYEYFRIVGLPVAVREGSVRGSVG